MTARPQVIFVRFRTNDSPKLQPWIAHARSVVGEAETTRTAASTDGLIVWQLVSANNRQLVRGLDVHATFEEARASVRVIASESGKLTAEYSSEAGHGRYGWYLKLDDRAVATCARWYLTERDRRNSIALALKSMAVAEVHAGARLAESGRERDGHS